MAESNNLVQITLRGKDELSATLRQVQQSLNALGKQQEQTAQAVTTAGQQSAAAWQRLGSVLGGLGIATGIAGVTAATIAFGKSVVDTGVKIEGLRASLTATSGSIKAGAQTFQFLIDTSNRLGTDLLTSANAFKSLQAATRGTVVEGQQTQQLFTAISGAIKVTGAVASSLDVRSLRCSRSSARAQCPVKSCAGSSAKPSQAHFRLLRGPWASPRLS